MATILRIMKQGKKRSFSWREKKVIICRERMRYDRLRFTAWKGKEKPSNYLGII